MADDKKYSFITVSSDDDDDVVIHAGAPAAEVSHGSDFASSQPAESAVASAAESVVVETVATLEPVAQPSPQPAASEQPKLDEPQPAPRSARKQYRETTLEDLDSSSMGGTQKVIIAVAVLGILAFIAYYVFFM